MVLNVVKYMRRSILPCLIAKNEAGASCQSAYFNTWTGNWGRQLATDRWQVVLFALSSSYGLKKLEITSLLASLKGADVILYDTKYSRLNERYST